MARVARQQVWNAYCWKLYHTAISARSLVGTCGAFHHRGHAGDGVTLHTCRGPLDRLELSVEHM